MASMISLIGILFSVFCCLLNGAIASKVYVITPSRNDHCLAEPCLTLTQFAAGSSKYLSDDTTLLLLSGNHYLETNLAISNVTKFHMLSMDSWVTEVRCKSSARLVFSHTSIINVTHVNFTGCVKNSIMFVGIFGVSNSSFAGHKNVTGTALEIINSSAILISNKFSFNRGSKSHSVMCNDTRDYRRRRLYYRHVSVMAGGAIVSTRSNISIIRSQFDGNSAQVGGVILSQSQSHIVIIDSVFRENHAIGIAPQHHTCGLCLAGGGVVHIENDCSLAISGSHFIGNKAHYFGGAIDILHAEDAAITVNNSTFIENRAKYGGVVDILGTYRTVVAISDSKFKNNIAERDGGVLALLSNIYLWSAYAVSVTITGSEFIENNAHNHGGVLAVSNTEKSAINVTDCDFISNSAQKGGGVLIAGHNEKTKFIISESLFNHNRAIKGGVIMLYENHRRNELAVERSKFRHNLAQSKGGVLYSEDRDLTIVVSESIFENSTADNGGAVYIYHSRLTVSYSTFVNNSATVDGGAFNLIRSRLDVMSSTRFESNCAGRNGGTIRVDNGKISILGAAFVNNSGSDGGVLYSQHTYSKLTKIFFSSNKAKRNGGVMCSKSEEVIITGSTIYNNVAKADGGAIQLRQSNLVIFRSEFMNNKAESNGGGLNIDQGTIILNRVLLTKNSANHGSVIWADHATITAQNMSVTKNAANSSAVYHMDSTANWSNVVFTSNIGSLCSVQSKITLINVTMTEMRSNVHHKRRMKSQELEEGGAITAFQGIIRMYGNIVLTKNSAQTGGAVHAMAVKIYAYGEVTVADNNATQNGGGFYLLQSELNCQGNSTLMLFGNRAKEAGGGIHAIGSSITINGTLIEQNYASIHFIGNKAELGGGLFLRMDAWLYILKSKAYTKQYKIIEFTANSANFGGAIYVSDDGICTSTMNKECFFQSLALYSSVLTGSVHQSIHCSNNTANTAGHSLYGGLLDRCTINPLADPDVLDTNEDGDDFLNKTIVTNGLDYLQMVSNIKASDIDSPPIRVCFCREGRPDCDYHPDPISIIKGKVKKFSLSLAVLNQINRPLEKASIINRLGSGSVLCQHNIHTTDGNCTKIDFTAHSNNETEELILFTDGPCKDSVDCQRRVKLDFFCPQCPVGFQLIEDNSEEGCRCDCDSKLKHFVSECNFSSQTMVRKMNCWITSINTDNSSSEQQYLVYPHCPLDYCQPPRLKLKLSLNLPNGSDAQCANGRSGLLCGSCTPGLSLSLGSSRCIPCSTHWPAKLSAILIAAFLAGILLVALLLLLNLTVATGTLNGIIFYANIVAASSNTFLPFTKPNFSTVFISWLNLEVGFDVCIFDGLDSFWKTLLQLVFPAYIILLVILVIFISETSPRFAKLIGKRNPVATLATLVLLSYAKLLHTIIASLSFAILEYPDSSRHLVWLPNASMRYLHGNHIVLFVIAIGILLVGLAYTISLFSWQWLLRYRINKLFKRKGFQKLCLFIEPYHAPYTFRHRYWTGMLLLVRVFLYIISAVNVSGDPQVSLVAIIFVVSMLLLVKGTIAKNLYKKQPVDVIETVMHINLVLFATITLYNFDINRNQYAVAHISTSIAFTLFIVIITFHVYKYTGVCSLFQNTKLFTVLDAKVRACYKQGKDEEDTSLDNEDDPPHQLRPTQSVVELHNLDEPTN